MRRSLLLIHLVAIGLIALAQNPAQNHSPLTIGRNYRVHPSNVSQSEIFLAKSPLNGNTFFASCITINFIPFFISEGIYVTTDNGSQWVGSDTCAGAPIDYHGGDPGIAIDKNGTFILTRLGRTPFVGLYSHYSTDQGRTWSTQLAISTDDLERASVTTDANPGSPFFGNTYAAWIPFVQPFPLMFSSTQDGGQHWSAQKQVNNPTRRCAGGDITVGINGEVFACWAGVTDFSPFKEVQVGYAKSEDGGASWSINENAFTISGISGLLTQKGNIRVNSLPAIAIDTTYGPRRGWIYIITCQKDLLPAGSDPDIVLYRSADGGSTWSQGIKVNQDELNNGKTQYFPAIHIDKSGTLNVIFYDDRNTTNDSSGVFLARSLNGGDSWSEFEITDHHFKPAPIGGLGQGYQGDNIDISSNDSELLPVLMYNSSVIYHIWTVPIKYSDINGIDDLQLNNTSFSLDQNFPNPALKSTMINWYQGSDGYLTLKLFDQTGRVIRILTEGAYKAGKHHVDVNVFSLSSGIYYYQMVFKGEIITRKMVVI